MQNAFLSQDSLAKMVHDLNEKREWTRFFICDQHKACGQNERIYDSSIGEEIEGDRHLALYSIEYCGLLGAETPHDTLFVMAGSLEGRTLQVVSVAGDIELEPIVLKVCHELFILGFGSNCEEETGN